ncbi:hypothetical protein N9893_00775 [bacterium]|nr:hypothetical protein [bacterium]
MTENEPARQDIFFQFDQLNKVLIDASSIIYMDRAKFLMLLASSIRLFSIQEILTETGPVSKRIKPLIHNKTASSNDQKLVSCALELNLPVISEDKKILMAMKRAGRPFFNSLMMLNFLLYRRRIQNQQYIQYHLALKKFARYSDDIWDYGAAVNAAINELI